MTDPIRVLHFADIHVGMENYGRTDPQTGLSTRVSDFLRRLDEMIAYATENDVDLVVFAGDAFKTRAPNPTYQREFAHRIRDLSRLAPTLLLVGNHDLPPTLLKASSIEIYSTLDVPNVTVLDDYSLRLIETKRGPVVVGSAPYPVRARLLEDERVAGLTIAQIDAQMQESLSQLLDNLATQAAEYDCPRLLTGHFTISGAVYGSEKQIMLGRDVEVLQGAVADPRWDYVAMGHIHRHQNVTAGSRGAPPVVYSGSMERIDFGEEGDPKGFCWVELERGGADWQFIPVNARPFVTLDADLRESETPTDDLAQLIARHHLRDAVVRLRLQLTPESEARLNENLVRDQLKHAGVYQVAGIRKHIEQAVRARLGEVPEGLTQLELLERYFISKGVASEDRATLIEHGRDLMEHGAGVWE